MTSSSDIADLLLRWEELRDQGKDISPEELCADHPEHLEELKRRISVLRSMDRVVDPALDSTRADPNSHGASGIPYPAIDGYDILGELGQGGMGIVYKALHRALNRTVALKMILAGKHAGTRQRQRFLTEAEALARVSHANIVQIYEVGEDEGCPYLCLEYVDGGTLAEKSSGVPHDPRQSAHLMEVLARAVHAAHQVGIVHRDLKPGNILMASKAAAGHAPKAVPEGEEPLHHVDLGVWGTPKITDFGLAKRRDSESGDGPTETQAILGTPCYMAPEQAEGHAKAAGPQTDVYALGAILYELLTGQPPFVHHEGVNILDQVRKAEPVPPRRLQSKIPEALQTICLKCLEKDPEQRYPTAEALAEDLNAYLTGGKIQAKPRGMLARLLRWAQQHPLTVLITLAFAVGTGALVSGGSLLGMVISNLAMLALVIGGGIANRRLKKNLRRMSRENLGLEQRSDQLQLLLETTRRLLSATDLDALQLIGETATHLVNAERATVYLVDQERKELWSKVVLGPNVNEIRLSLGTGIAGTVAATGQIINLDDAYADPRFNREIDIRTGYKTRNLLTFPMTTGHGKILGVLQLVNKRAGGFTLEDIAALQPLTSAATVVMERMLDKARDTGAPRTEHTHPEAVTTTEHFEPGDKTGAP